MQQITATNGKVYRQSLVTGLCYDPNTPQRVINLLETHYKNDTRLILVYGYTETYKGANGLGIPGTAWLTQVEFNGGDSWIRAAGDIGYIQRSTGTIKVPLCICRKNSHGGNAVSDVCIVAIYAARGKRLLYQHPKFQWGMPVKNKE